MRQKCCLLRNGIWPSLLALINLTVSFALVEFAFFQYLDGRPTKANFWGDFVKYLEALK